MARLKLPFELEKPSSNEYVTQASEIGMNGRPLDEVLDEMFLYVDDDSPTPSNTSALCGSAICGYAICGTN